MRELSEYLVARRGAERAAARAAVDISQHFLCKEDRTQRVRAALLDEQSIAAGIATFCPAGVGHSTIVHDREAITEPAIEEIAVAIPDFGLLD